MSGQTQGNQEPQFIPANQSSNIQDIPNLIPRNRIINSSVPSASKESNYQAEFHQANLFKDLNIKVNDDTYAFTDGKGNKYNVNKESDCKLLGANCTNFLNDCLRGKNLDVCKQLVNDENMILVSLTSASEIIKVVKEMNVVEIHAYLTYLGFHQRPKSNPYPSGSNIMVPLCESVEEWLSSSLDENQKQIADLFRNNNKVQKLLNIFVSYVNCFPSLFDPAYQYPTDRGSQTQQDNFFSIKKEIFNYKDLRDVIRKGVDGSSFNIRRDVINPLNQLRNYQHQSLGMSSQPNLLGLAYTGFGQIPLPGIYARGGLAEQGYKMNGGDNGYPIQMHPFVKVSQSSKNIESLEKGFEAYKGSSSELLKMLLQNITKYVSTVSGGKYNLADTTTKEIQIKIAKIAEIEKEAMKELENVIKLAKISVNTNGVINPFVKGLNEEEQKRILEDYGQYVKHQQQLGRKQDTVMTVLQKILEHISNFDSKQTPSGTTSNIRPLSGINYMPQNQ